MHVIGLGDQVVDKYEDIQVMYPGGNAMNLAHLETTRKQHV